ncbi:YHYH domain-containing protein [Cupriavidus sp. AcVe19-6a]|uniref:YHYH domain-containing protein n=1 Tax=Cupriavidus sp. AcVe19-6a TaxID=2821358 RepID=UPI001AE997BE|nr:YHYH domain-containing protein [Cupriavidus sp. AcVe19-6a]MBP0639119.1 YHYH domain-containing protein [Cupriavidus sp. AcVe19-6a]
MCRWTVACKPWPVGVALVALWVSIALSSPAHAHGGGLDANGCHTNRTTGDYHCHRGGGGTNFRLAGEGTASAPRSVNSLASNRSAPPGQKCYVGPRGGTYTLTASGRKNYGGC